ncbi:hypothetical protein DJ84_13995 [Halorubrum ezzemoulense]|nr:hypothetical protein DJ84_13995 [Halorubrum ezzemoulense]
MCLLLAAGGGYLTYQAQTAPDTETRTEVAGTWSVETGFTHGADVVNGTATFTEGDRLTNRSLYFTRITPVLDGEYVVTPQGDGGPANGSVELRMVIEAVDAGAGGTQGEPTVYWRESETIETVTVEGLDSGEERRIAFEANTTALSQRVAEIEEQLGASPGTARIAVVAETGLEATVEDDRFVDARTDRLTIEPDGNTYSVEQSVSEGQTYEATRTVEVPVEPSPLAPYGGPILLVIGLLGAGTTVLARRDDLFAVSDAEWTRLEFVRARDDLDKWISTGRVPTDDDRTVAELDSLRDLVNVAIDSDRRVIERADATPRYVVLDDDVRYVFDPPAAATAGGIPESNSLDETDSRDATRDDDANPTRTRAGTDSTRGE